MAQNRRDLFLSVSGDVGNLSTAMKAGRTALLSLGDAATDVQAEVQKALAGMAANAPAEAKRIDQAYAQTFAAIRRNAQSVLDAGSNAGALKILDTAGAEQAARAAEAQAAALRISADAAAAVAARQGEAGIAAKVLAAALEVQAVDAAKGAAALRGQAGVLGEVAAEARLLGAREDELGGSHARMGASGMIAEHVVRSMSDSIAAGQSPVRAMTMEMGRITEAMTLYAATTNASEGAMGKFAAFMGGPYGIAISIGVAVLTPLIGKLIESGDAAETAKKALNEYASFMDDLGNFVDRATGKIIEQNKALAEGAKLRRDGQAHEAAQRVGSLKSQAFELARDQKVQVGSAVGSGGIEVADYAVDPRVQKIIDQAGGSLPKLLAGIKALAAANPNYESLYRKILDLGTQAQKSYQDFKRLRGEIDEIGQAQAGGTVLNSQIIEHRVTERNATDALSKAEAQLADLRAQGTAIDKLDPGPDKDRAYAKWEKDLNAATAAVNRLKQARKDSTTNRQSGREVNLSQAEAIVHGIGGRVTSSQRSYAEQQALYERYRAGKGSLAAKPGTSLHERGEALDVAKGPGISLGALKKAFADKGVHLTEALDEGDHYHVGFGPKGKAGPSQETIQRREQAAADKRTRDAEAYAQLLGRAQEENLQLTRQQTLGIAAAADLDVKAVEIERQRLDSAAQAGFAERRWTQAQADALKAVNASNAQLKTIEIRNREGQQLLNQQIDADRDQLDRANALLNLQGELAVTNRARRDIALRLLANEEKMQRDQALRLIGSDNPNDWARGEAMLQGIDEQHPYRVKQIDRQFADPMQNYRQQLQGNVGDMNEALKGVEADGLKGLEDGLIGIISGTESVADAFKHMAASIIADLARIAIEKLILSVIGLKDGGEVLHLAGGGPVYGPGGPREDRVPAMLSAGEYVINAHSYSKHPQLVEAINTGKLPMFADGGLVAPERIYMRSLPSAASIARANSGGQSITFDLRGAVMTEDLLRQMNQISARHAMVSIVAGSQQAQQDIADRQAQVIPT